MFAVALYTYIYVCIYHIRRALSRDEKLGRKSSVREKKNLKKFRSDCADGNRVITFQSTFPHKQKIAFIIKFILYSFLLSFFFFAAAKVYVTFQWISKF